MPKHSRSNLSVGGAKRSDNLDPLCHLPTKRTKLDIHDNSECNNSFTGLSANISVNNKRPSLQRCHSESDAQIKLACDKCELPTQQNKYINSERFCFSFAKNRGILGGK